MVGGAVTVGVVVGSICLMLAVDLDLVGGGKLARVAVVVGITAGLRAVVVVVTLVCVSLRRAIEDV